MPHHGHILNGCHHGRTLLVTIAMVLRGSLIIFVVVVVVVVVAAV